MKALLVEDSRACATHGKEVLYAAGYRVFRQGHAFGARLILNAFEVDLAVVDANIPERENELASEGAGLVVAALAQSRNPRCRVIMWSSDQRVERLVKQMGAAFAWKEDKEALARAVRGA